MDPDVVRGLLEHGLMGIEIPQEYGGAGGSFMSAVLVVEEMAKVDPSVSVFCDIHNTVAVTTIRNYASEALCEKYLPSLATSKVASFCLSETSSGSDAFALSTRASKLKNGDYMINGSKMWISNSNEAEIFLVFANLDPSKGYKGITCFLVEKDMGVEVAKKEKKLGIRASSTCTVNFDNVIVPMENRIGEEGMGYK